MGKLTPWTLPESYYGQTWEGYLIAPVGRNRDSDLLTESNWQAQLNALEETPDLASDVEAWQVVARSMGMALHDLIKDLCSDDIYDRARGYQAIYDYHGWIEGDQYPATMTRAEVEARYATVLNADD